MARKLIDYGYKLCNKEKKVCKVTNSLWLAKFEKSDADALALL